jgi:hypothetical protein
MNRLLWMAARLLLICETERASLPSLDGLEKRNERKGNRLALVYTYLGISIHMAFNARRFLTVQLLAAVEAHCRQRPMMQDNDA